MHNHCDFFFVFSPIMIQGLKTSCHSISVTFFCAVLGAQGIRATGFKRAQGNAHCAKFESNTNRMTFETNAISTTSGIQARM